MKVTVLVCVLVATAALAGCGNDDDASSTTAQPIAEHGPDESKLESTGPFEQAAGVTYPDDDPDAFAERPRSESCGREGVAPPESGEGFVETQPEPEARLCLLRAWASGSEAELTTAFPTVEGPALVILRVLPGATVERYELDPFGQGPIVQECQTLKADGEPVPASDPPLAEAPRKLDAAACARPQSLG
jgi:hypothetical protein